MSNLARQLETSQQQSSSTSRETKSLPKSRSITFGEKVLYFITVIGLVVATFFVISTYASIYITNHEIHSLERSISEQITNNEALQLQVTELSAPDRILQIATEQLGMILNDKNVKVVQN